MSILIYDIDSGLNTACQHGEEGLSLKNPAYKGYLRILLYTAVSAAALLTLKYLLPYFLPLLIAFIIVIPLQKFCCRRGIPGAKGKGIMAGGILFCMILCIALLIVGVITFLLGKARNLAQNAGYLADSIMLYLKNMTYNLENYIGMENGLIIKWLEDKAAGIGNKIAVESNVWISDGIRYMADLGQAATFFIISFICVVLFAREVDAWQNGLLKLAAIEPAIDKVLSIILRIGKKLGAMIKTFLKTQGIILLCISILASAGLYLSGMKDSYFYGFLAGFMDFLPFIGTGIVLVPICVLNFISGNIFGGITVLVTYFACVLIRELMEPKLMGNGLRFSPVAVLIAVYAGILYFGISGVILGPIALLILVELGREIFMGKARDE